MLAYAKTCLAKGENLPEFPRDQFKNVNRKSQVNTVSNKIEAKPSNKDISAKETRNIVAENIMKQGKKLYPVKRISATSNLVYEFSPFNVEQTRPLTSQTYLWRRNNSEQIFPHFKTDTTSVSKSALNRNPDLAKRKSSAILPELNSRTDFTTADTDSNVMNSSTKNTCLPLLNKEDLTKTLNEQVVKEYEQSDIERKIENVKSAWQVLREERDWTKGKDHTGNAQAKKLYEMLEKMTCEIDRVQKNYKDPKANHYLRKSATNVLRTGSKSNLQEEAEIAKSVIFSDKKARTKSAVFHLKNVDSEIIGKDMVKIRFDETAENISTDNQSHKNLPSSKYTAKKRSIHTNAHGRNDARSVHTIATNICNKKRDTVRPTSDNKLRTRIKSSIEEYLQCYSDNVHKSRGIDEDEHSRDVKLSASDIADILASHNIESHVLYENFEKHSDYSDDYASENEDCSYLNTTSNATQVMSADTIQENRKIGENTSFENMELCNDTRFTQATDTRAFDIRTQSSATNCRDNAFIKIGLNKDLSRDALSQILQSEYLKKDLSL